MLNRIVIIVFILLVIISALYALRDTKDYTTSSDEAYALLMEGQDLRSKLYNARAIEKFEEAVKLDSNFSLAWLELAQAARNYGRNELAVEHLAKANANYDKLKDHEKMYLDIFNAYFDNKLDESRKIARKYTEKFPKRLDGHLLLASDAWESGDIQTAINEYNKILIIDSEYAPAYNSLGYLEFGNGNFNKALEYFDVYIKLLPDQANPHDSRGEILMAVGRYDEALQEFKTAQQIEPKFAFVLYHMKDVYTYKGIFDKVDKIFQQIETLCSDESEKRNLALQRLRSYVQRGDTTSALNLANEFINNSLDERSEYLKFWGAINASLALHGYDIERASQYLETARNIHETQLADKIESGAVVETQGWLLVAESLINLEKKNYQDILVLEDIVKDKRFWRPDMLIDIKNILAMAYYHLNRKVDCFSIMKANLALNPNHPSTNYFMAQIYELDGNISLAIEHINNMLELYKDADDKFIRLTAYKDKLAELTSLAGK